MKQLCSGIMLVIGCCTVVDAADTVSADKPSTRVNQKVMGGWYPVFFDQYNESQVKLIVKNSQEGRVAKMVITFDENYSLAKKILAKIQPQVNFVVECNQVKLEDGTAQFNHKRVVVTVYNSAN